MNYNRIIKTKKKLCFQFILFPNKFSVRVFTIVQHRFQKENFLIKSDVLQKENFY